MADQLIRLSGRWRAEDGRQFRAGWVIVDEATATEAREAKATDEGDDLVPPADYAGMFEEQQAAAKQAKAEARKAARQARQQQEG